MGIPRYVFHLNACDHRTVAPRLPEVMAEMRCFSDFFAARMNLTVTRPSGWSLMHE